VFSSSASGWAGEGTDGYSVQDDFCKVFNDHIEHLYTLAFLLTADHSKAEQCVVGALEECLEGAAIFKDWLLSWSKRAIIKNAIHIVSPSASEARVDSVNGTIGALIQQPDRYPVGQVIARAITALHPFDRFVYVLSLLKRYSDRDCSLLLDSSVAEIVRARERSLQHVAALLTNVDFRQLERRPGREPEGTAKKINHEVSSRSLGEKLTAGDGQAGHLESV
jgi:hypothetical protein